MDSWIYKMVRGRCLRRIAAWAVVLAFVTIFGIGQRRYFQNFLFGPYNLGTAELDEIRDVSEAPRYFVRVSGSKVIDSGLRQTSIRKMNGSETVSSFYALAIGNKFLICKSESSSSITYEGVLAPVTAELAWRFFDNPDIKSVRDRFYPYYLSDQPFRSIGYFGIAFLLVGTFFMVKHAVPAWRYFQDPTSHPVSKRIQCWGDPIVIAVAAQREAEMPWYKSGNGWLVTDQFLVQSTFFTFNILRLSDLLWAYKKVTRHSVNHIPTNKMTYGVVLVCNGGNAIIDCGEGTAEEILKFAAKRAPWAILGFSNVLQAHYNKNMSAFCDSVEQRRQEWLLAAQQLKT